MDIRRIIPADQAWIRQQLSAHFASPRIVSRGVMHQADELPGLVAVHEESPVGLLLYDLRGEHCEVVVLLVLEEGRGVATTLLEAIKSVAMAVACRRLWLITTNDNLAAIRFYQRRGWTMVALHQGALAEARKLKPELPVIGRGGIPMRDEIEFEWPLHSS